MMELPYSPELVDGTARDESCRKPMETFLIKKKGGPVF
jgi:hypothetical protein